MPQKARPISGLLLTDAIANSIQNPDAIANSTQNPNDVTLSKPARRKSRHLHVNVFKLAVRAWHRVKAEGNKRSSSGETISPTMMDRQDNPTCQKISVEGCWHGQNEELGVSGKDMGPPTSRIQETNCCNLPAKPSGLDTWRNGEETAECLRVRDVGEVTAGSGRVTQTDHAHSLIWHVVIRHCEESKEASSGSSPARSPPQCPEITDESTSRSSVPSLDTEKDALGADGTCTQNATACARNTAMTGAAINGRETVTCDTDTSSTTTEVYEKTSSSHFSDTAASDNIDHAGVILTENSGGVLTGVFVRRDENASALETKFISAACTTVSSPITAAAQHHLSSECSVNRPDFRTSAGHEQTPDCRTNPAETVTQQVKRLYAQRKLISKPSPGQHAARTSGQVSRQRTRSLPALSEVSQAEFKDNVPAQHNRGPEKSLLARVGRLPRLRGKSSTDLASSAITATPGGRGLSKTSSPASPDASVQNDAKQPQKICGQRKRETGNSPASSLTRIPRASRLASTGSATDALSLATPRGAEGRSESAKFLASSAGTPHIPVAATQLPSALPRSCDFSIPARSRASRLPHATRQLSESVRSAHTLT